MFCEGCDAQIHAVRLHVADIEKDLKAAIERFDASPELRTCPRCGHVQPDVLSWPTLKEWRRA